MTWIESALASLAQINMWINEAHVEMQSTQLMPIQLASSLTSIIKVMTSKYMQVVNHWLTAPQLFSVTWLVARLRIMQCVWEIIGTVNSVIIINMFSTY